MNIFLENQEKNKRKKQQMAEKNIANPDSVLSVKEIESVI